MTKERIELGRLGEELALKRIKRLGYRKIIRNYRCPLGEMDLIARDGDTLVFIEIKTRRGGPTSYAKEAVDERKRRQLSKVALAYMKSNDCCETRARFDVIAVSLEEDEPRIEVVKNAFEAAY
ncbi:MAG: YraN family protein [Thermodesulfobacteriota bacterium]|nr:YraN family protein [Thermodesulfobacteriota bacterium]